MIADLTTKRIQALSQWQTFIRVLRTRWRQKSTGIDEKQNCITVTPYIVHCAKYMLTLSVNYHDACACLTLFNSYSTEAYCNNNRAYWIKSWIYNILNLQKLIQTFKIATVYRRICMILMVVTHVTWLARQRLWSDLFRVYTTQFSRRFLTISIASVSIQ